MKRARSQGFWTGGPEAYAKALREEQDERLTPLTQALKGKSDPRIKQDLKDHIRAIWAEFKQRRKAADGSLF